MTRRTAFSRKEANNLVYMILKYTCLQDDPDNGAIAQILKHLKPRATVDDLIMRTLSFNLAVQNDPWPARGFAELIHHARWVATEFFKQPEQLRNALGQDEAFFCEGSIN